MNTGMIVSDGQRNFQMLGMSPKKGITELTWAMNKIAWLIDCEKGDLILPGLLGIMIAHSRETVFNQLV